MKIIIPDDVKLILNTLGGSGFEAYVVGGCVRDSLLGLEPKDWDVTTSAKPDEIKRLFSDFEQITSGEKHGTVAVIINHIPYEITTYRLDGDYLDSRHPESVSFTDSIEADLARRDFTVNAMAYSEAEGLVDPFNGAMDLKYLALRCVGEPDRRFGEDALRILRALRFASVYNLSIESSTSDSILRNRRLLGNISAERIAAEFSKMICGGNISFVLRRYREVIAVIFPEIVATVTCEQNTPHHNKTVWNHTVAAVAGIEGDLLLRTVMFFHDIGKPLALRTDSKGIDHFKGHNHYSAVLAENALKRLKFPTAFIENIKLLVDYHDVRMADNRKQIKHVLNNIGEENFRRLLKIQKADIEAQSGYYRDVKLGNLALTETEFEDILSSGECFSLKGLAVNGSDLLHLGISEGKAIGFILNSLLDAVINGEIANEKTALKKRAVIIYNETKEPSD